jgi:hypothetical protein
MVFFFPEKVFGKHSVAYVLPPGRLKASGPLGGQSR